MPILLFSKKKPVSGCFEILTNLASDLSVEVKIVRKDVVPLLVKCAEFSTRDELRLAVVRMLLKLSIFQENITILVGLFGLILKGNVQENSNIADTILGWFPLEEPCLAKTCVRFLFNLVFSQKFRTKLVKGGLVSHIAPLIKSEGGLDVFLKMCR